MDDQYINAFVKKVEYEKSKKLLDLMRQATANHTHVEVAMVVAKDWHPIIVIDADGKIEIVIGDH